LVGLVVGILIVGDLTRRMTDARRMQRDADNLAVEVADLQSANTDLEEKIAGALDDANVSEWARSQAKLVQERERLVVPVPMTGAEAESQTADQQSAKPPSPWEVWWALLWGG